ncbi:MAG: hypothetical protein NVS3B10_00130 [Polyangiales bacterium]
MIRSVREQQRTDLFLFQTGIAEWLRGEPTVTAFAAGMDVAELIIWMRRERTDKKE